MQEQQQKMWQDNLRRQQMYVYYKGKQQKKLPDRKVVSCAVCGSVLLIKTCPFCGRFFCNTHLSIVKFGLNGHQCVARKPVPTRLSQPQVIPKNPKRPAESSENKKNEQDEMLDLLDRILEEDEFEFES